MNKRFSMVSLAVLAAVGLAACGGGGSGGDSGSGTSNTNVIINVTPDGDVSLTAGDTQAIKATGSSKAGAVTSIGWTVTALEGQAAALAPTVADASCASISKSGGNTVNGIATTGNATCETTLSIPSTSSGSWKVEGRIVGTNSSAAVDSFTLKVQPKAVVASGFKVVVPEKPVQIEENIVASFTAGFTANTGVNVQNVSYKWSLVSATPTAGGTASTTTSLVGAESPTVSFLAGTATNYVLKVVATATVGGNTQTSEANVVAYTASKTSPAFFTVSAGATQLATANTVVSLTGVLTGNTSNPVYQWTQISGPKVTIANANTATASVLPLEPGVYEFDLSVTSGGVTKNARTVVAVNTFSVSAGPAQTATLNTVTSMTASVVGTAANATYQWAQTDGPTNVALSSANTATASFVPTQAGTYRFVVSVTSGGVTRTSESVVVVNLFEISAGNAQVAGVVNVAVILPSSVTGQTTGLTYQWTQESGPETVVIANANSATASFVGTTAGQYVFTLTVSSGSITKTTRTVAQVTARPVASGTATTSP